MQFQQKLERRRLYNHLRQLPKQNTLVDFSSNDYLGLARSPELSRRVLKEWEQALHFQLGSTGSRLLTGNSLYAEKLEADIAHFHTFEAGLLFNCGYMANVGLLSAIADEQCSVLFDSAIHASTRDGIRLSQANAYPFRHNDLNHLETRLKLPSKGDRFICIESIYSTDGSIAPLVEISQLAEKYGAHLIVDEAHAVGVFGAQGKGAVAHYGLTQKVFAQIITFGKALGVFGSIVLGSHSLKQALLNFAHSAIYTTALPMSTLAAIKCSYDLFPHMEQERERIQPLIKACSYSPTHIQAVPIIGNEAAKQKSHELALRGFDVKPLLSPTVQRGKECLRICLHAYNRVDEVVALLEGIYG